MRNKFIPKFPKNEKGILFYNPEGKPFFAAQVGITYAFPEYSIEYKKPANDNMTILEYVLEGEMEILINGVWQKAVAGDTYVLTGCVAHRYHTVPNNPCKKIFVNYYSEYLPHFLAAYKVGYGIYQSNTEQLFLDLLHLLDNYVSDAEDIYTISNSVNSIIVRLSQDKYDSFSSRIKAKLDTLLLSKISLDDVSRELGISKSTLIRTFKKNFNITPYDYVLQQKINYAKYLLDATDLLIYEIADKICILDEHHFSLLFKKITGFSPLNYKKRPNKTVLIQND